MVVKHENLDFIVRSQIEETSDLKNGEKNKGEKVSLKCVGTLVRPLWRAAGYRDKAHALAARPVGNGPGQFLGC